ncbi:MAG: transketolase-like TK C-terminal-containing protein, partial [Mycobacteriaceae bacterium]
EAGIAMPWHRLVGTDGEVVSIEHFGASADHQTLFREFGLTDEAVTAAAQRSLARVEE